MMDKLGDKIKSKIVAKSVGVPVIPGVEKPIASEDEAFEVAKLCGFPVMIKAAAGGGGRGMRIVRKEEELLVAFRNAKNEAKKLLVMTICLSKNILKDQNILKYKC